MKPVTLEDVKRWSTEDLWTTALSKARTRTRKVEYRKLGKPSAAVTPSRGRDGSPQVLHLETQQVNAGNENEGDLPDITNFDEGDIDVEELVDFAGKILEQTVTTEVLLPKDF